ncbi:FAD dependent oxidoreductase [Lichtheimia hyalospora FSU 10163]|nr:FAD dependent oxidoreductase [Lichtheimia hyalospora FSU 10163]
MHVAIIGAGAIGSSTAYFLSQRAKTTNVRITVIEKTGVACAASGRAGGFIARDWSDGTPLGPLSRKSYELHGELANKLGGEAKYGYRHVNTYSALLQSKKSKNHHGSVPGEVAWIDQEKVRRVEQLGVPSSTAQVHPRQFTQTLMDAAVATGFVKLKCGQGVVSLAYQNADNKVVTGVVLENGETIEADAVIVCMGPWSGLLKMQGRRRTNHLPIHGVRAHSIIFEPNQPVPAEALFTAVIDGSQSHEPEDGTVYMCGATDNSDPLPPSADQVKVKESAIEQLELLRELIAPSLSGKTTIRQACYLPISRDDMPFIGAHPSHSQLYLATGHSCWGILNSPVTGLMITELLLDGRITCVEREAVEAFDPKGRC